MSPNPIKRVALFLVVLALDLWIATSDRLAHEPQDTLWSAPEA